MTTIKKLKQEYREKPLYYFSQKATTNLDKDKNPQIATEIFD